MSAVGDNDAASVDGEHLQAAVENAAKLGVSALSMRYVDSDAGSLTSAEKKSFGADAWVATVRTSYRSALDQAPTRLEATAVFAPDDDGARLVAFGGHQRRTPLWLLGPVTVTRAGAVSVIAAQPEAGSSTNFVRLAETARRQVAEVLGPWRIPLVLEVPSTGQQMAQLLATAPGTYDTIAAVTTSVDGSRVAGSPVHIYVNPGVFGTLRSRGAQVVMTHEATHVATEATSSSMPLWLLEGFADYVAIEGAGVPVATAASQILKQIRSEGVPEALPSAEELSPSASGLGATYELAWLACRSMAQRFGEAQLISFYRVIDRGTPVADAFEGLGTTQQQFVRQWRNDLARLAGGANG